MSTQGPSCGLDLVYCMQLGGDLENMWIYFDLVCRVSNFPTMSTHKYDAFEHELLQITTSELRVEDHYVQFEFWKMLNGTMIKNGFIKPKHKGFMADEPNAN